MLAKELVVSEGTTAKFLGIITSAIRDWEYWHWTRELPSTRTACLVYNRTRSFSC